MLASEIIHDLKITIIRQRRVILDLAVALVCVCVFTSRANAVDSAPPVAQIATIQSSCATARTDTPYPGRRFNLKNEFTTPECDYFRAACNFTPEEREIFDMRVSGCSLAEIQMSTNVSEATINRRLAAIKRKIYKVL